MDNGASEKALRHIGSLVAERVKLTCIRPKHAASNLPENAQFANEALGQLSAPDQTATANRINKCIGGADRSIQLLDNVTTACD